MGLNNAALLRLPLKTVQITHIIAPESKQPWLCPCALRTPTIGWHTESRRRNACVLLAQSCNCAAEQPPRMRRNLAFDASALIDSTPAAAITVLTTSARRQLQDVALVLCLTSWTEFIVLCCARSAAAVPLGRGVGSSRDGGRCGRLQ